MSQKPVVLVSTNFLEYNGTKAYITREFFVDVLHTLCGSACLLLPSHPKSLDLDSILSRVDGVLLTGSPAHVNPDIYGEKRLFEDKDLDHDRDGTCLPLIKAAIQKDIPLLAICRGFQELNVACGGTLEQYVHKLPGKHDHRPDENRLMECYRTQAHAAKRQKGGLLEKWGLPETFRVNSLHTQGVKTLGKDLFIEAYSDDDLIEAVSIPKKKFIFGTQWHPEGDYASNESSRVIFQKFGEALHTSAAETSLFCHQQKKKA